MDIHRQMHMHTHACTCACYVCIYMHVNTVYYNCLKTFQAVHMDIYIQEWLNRIYQITRVEVRLLLLWCTQTSFGTQHLYNLQAFKIGTWRSASVAFDDEQYDLFCSKLEPEGVHQWLLMMSSMICFIQNWNLKECISGFGWWAVWSVLFKIGTWRSASVALDDEQYDLFCSKLEPEGVHQWLWMMSSMICFVQNWNLKECISGFGWWAVWSVLFKIGTWRSASVALDDEQYDLFCFAGPQGKLFWPHFMSLKNKEKI